MLIRERFNGKFSNPLSSNKDLYFRCFELNKCPPQFIKPDKYKKICEDIHGNDEDTSVEENNIEETSSFDKDTSINEKDCSETSNYDEDTSVKERDLQGTLDNTTSTDLQLREFQNYKAEGDNSSVAFPEDQARPT